MTMLLQFAKGQELGKLMAAYEIRRVLLSWPAWTDEEWHKEFAALAKKLESEAQFTATLNIPEEVQSQ